MQPDLFGESGLRVASREEKEVRSLETGPIEPFITDTKRLLVEFRESWKGSRSPETTGKDHLKTLSTILACIESSVKGLKIDVDKFQRGLEFPQRWL